MAASLLLLLLVSACTAELGFKPKRQYTYLYEAKQASGIPGLQSQWSAFGMKMDVVIQVPTKSNLYIKLNNVQQGELKNVHTHQPWRKNFSMPYSPIQHYQEELSRVFKVEMNGGVISKVMTKNDEPIWVVNIKKSIAQLFQLDMQKHQATDMPSSARPSDYQRGHQAEFFRVMEDSIGGECETLYETTPQLPQNMKADMLQELTILSQSSLDGIQVPKLHQFEPFIVTKTKNYQNCKSRPNWQHMMPGAVSCRSDDCYLTASNRSATAHYVLDGDRSSFQIQYVLAESEALMFPYGHETEQLWTVTNQTLFLKKTGPMGSFFGEPQSPKSHRRLAFQYPTADSRKLQMPDLKSPPQLSVHLPGAPVKVIQSHLPTSQLINTVTGLIQKVDQLLHYVPDPVQQDVAGYVVEIDRALSWLSYNQLEQVYTKLTSQGQKDIYWDALALAGTNPAVMKIISGIYSREVDSDRMVPLLATLPINIKTPTYELIERLFQLFKSPVVQWHQLQRMTMALSLGNIFYQICISNTTVEHSYTQGLYPQHFCCSQTYALLKEQFIPFLERKIEGTPELERLSYIQALGNIGDRQITSVLRKLVTDQNTPLEASKAIYAFYRIAPQYPEKVRKIVSPIFHDVSRHTDVRLAAVTMLLATNPPIAHWQKIATSTWYEPSNAVVAFIHSTYSSLANITMAQVQPLFEMSRRARITYPLIRPPPSDLTFSGSYNYRNGKIIPQYQVAALTHISLIASRTSVIPSVVYMEFQHYINSIVYSTHRWNLNVQGGQKLIDDLLGVGTNFPHERRSPRDLHTAPQNFMDSVQLQQQQPEKFQATLYTQLMAAMDTFFVFDDNNYNTLVQKIYQGGSWSEKQMQKIAFLEDTTITFPSEIGMPIIYSKKMPMVTSVRGQMSAEWSQEQGQYQVSMENIQPFVAIKSLVTVSTVSPFSLLTLGAGVQNMAQLSLPMSLNAKLDVQAKKLQVEVGMTRQPSSVKIAHLQTMPFTTGVDVNTYENFVTSPDTKEITLGKKTSIKLPFGESFGVDGYLRLVSDSPIMNFGTFWTELKKRGTSGVTNFWFMMGSLRSRHYDIVIDTTKSNLEKVQATFAIVPQNGVGTQMRQPTVRNQEHNSEVTSTIRKTRQLMQDRQWLSLQMARQERLAMDTKVAYVATVTMLQKSGKMQHYNSFLALASDPMWYGQKLSFRATSATNRVCLDTEMAFPALSDNRQKLLTTEVKMPVRAKLGYGSSCEEHILEMHGEVGRDELAKKYAMSCPQAQRCIQHEMRGNPNSADCRLAKDHAALVSYFDFEFTEQNLPKSFRKASYRLENFVKYVLWPYMKDDPFSKNANNKVSIKLRFKPTTNGMSLHIFKPFATTKFEDVPLPFNMLQEPGMLTMRKSISKKVADNLFGVDRTVCLVDRLVVKTFDNVTLERQPSDCWTLLAGDGSRTRDVAIYEKVVNHQSVVRVLVDGTVIEIDSSHLGRLRVRDEEKHIRPLEHITVRDTADERTLADILMITEDTLKVVLPSHYIKLIVSKEGVQIHPSLLAYRSRMRGICGDFDGEQQYDLVGPTGCLYQNGQKFYDAYRVPLDNSSQCETQPPPHCIRRPRQTGQTHQYYQTEVRH